MVELESEAPPRAAWVPIAFACVALAARPLSFVNVLVTGAVGMLGLLAPARDRIISARRSAGVASAGIAAFAVARMVGSPVGVRVSAFGALTLCVISVAEEAFFRRYVYSWAMRWRAGGAIAIAAFLFAIVHVPVYGWRAFGVDLAAGALLGWQRWASGTWTVPALTHVIADLLQVG